MNFRIFLLPFLVLLLTLFTFSVYGQSTSPIYSDNQIYQYDSIKYSTFFNGSWRLGVIKKKFQYPSNRITVETYDVNLDSSLTVTEKAIYAINSNGLSDTIYTLSNGGSPGNLLDTVYYRLLKFDNYKNLLSDTSYFNNNGSWELSSVNSYVYDSLNRIISSSNYTASQNSTLSIKTFNSGLNFKKDSVKLFTPIDTIFWGIDNREYLSNGNVSKYFYVSSNMDTTTINTFYYNNQNSLDSIFIDSSFPFAYKYNYDSVGIIKEFIQYTENNSIFTKSSLEEYFNFMEISGMSLNKDFKSIGIFPNPSNGQLYFKLENPENNNYQIEIFDLNGVLIKSFNDNFRQPSINIQDIKSGIYLYKFILGENVDRGKIILR